MSEEAIESFAEEMKRVMEENSREKRDSWKHMSLEDLDKKLKEEYKEWKEEIYSKEELVDIANCCMMVWNRLEEGSE